MNCATAMSRYGWVRRQFKIAGLDAWNRMTGSNQRSLAFTCRLSRKNPDRYADCDEDPGSTSHGSTGIFACCSGMRGDN
jgi:hypothetical protein